MINQTDCLNDCMAMCSTEPVKTSISNISFLGLAIIVFTICIIFILLIELFRVFKSVMEKNDK